MQRLSVGSRLLDDGGGAAAVEEADEKAGKAAARAAPDKSIHLIPVLTLLCFLVLFLLSHDPAASSSLPTATESPVLATAAARSLEATAETTASMGRNGGVHRRLKQEPRLPRGRRMGMALLRRRR